MSRDNAIDFGEHKWTAMSDEMASRIGSSRLPLSSKVMLAIQTGMNNWGHAYFGPGGTELGRIVYGRAPTRGMMNTLKEKIKDYRADGFIAPGKASNAWCSTPSSTSAARAGATWSPIPASSQPTVTSGSSGGQARRAGTLPATSLRATTGALRRVTGNRKTATCHRLPATCNRSPRAGKRLHQIALTRENVN